MPDLSEFVKELESSTNLADYAKSLGISINRYSLAHCIASDHPDKKASMSFKEDYANCFGCGFSAKAIKLTQVVKGVDFKEALNILCDYRGVPRFQFGKQSQEEALKYEEKRKKEDRFYEMLHEAVKIYQSSQNPYLTEKRGISKDLIEQMKIGATNGNKSFLKNELLKKGFKLEEFSPLLLNQYKQDFFQECVIIPILKEGRCIGLYGRKYDNSKEFKHLYLKKEGFEALGIEPKTTLFNWDNARKFKTIYIFESIIDCLSALSNGIENSVSIYGTQGLKEEHLKQLERSGVKEVNLVMDGDLAGQQAAITHGYRIEDLGISVKALVLPNRQDPNEYFLNGGTKESFMALSQHSPLQLAIQSLNPNLHGNEFLSAIEPILKRVAAQDPLIWDEGLEEIKNHFTKKPSISKLEAKIKEIARNQRVTEDQALVAIPKNRSFLGLSTIFEDASLEGMVVPQEWSLTEQGISQVKFKPNGEPFFAHVSYYPIIITASAKDIDENHEFITLKYKKEGKIYTIQTDRKTISEQRSITILSERGFPVNSVNAKQIIRYLEDFEATNISQLKKISITHGFGHKYDFKGNLIFYLPQKTYNSNESLVFEGRGPGDYEYFKALQPKGTLEEWVNAIKSHCLSHPLVMFNLFDGFSVPLLRRYEIQKSSATDHHGRTSTGKTTTNEIVASIYGNPAKLILQWNFITPVAIEQIAGLFNGIPIFLDDSQNADEKKISEMIYLIAHGLGKARGYKYGGLQRTLDWVTKLFSTGERKILEQVKKEGAEARIWSFGISPFGSEEDKETARKVRAIKKAIYQNYGVAIMPFLDYAYSLDQNRLIAYFNDAYKFFDQQIAKGGKAHRQIEYWAAVLATGMLVEEVFHFGCDPVVICKSILEMYQQEGFTDPVTEAMEDVISWINSNDNLYDLSGKSYEESEKINFGQRHGIKKPGEYIAVFPHILKDFLVKQGYSPSIILKGWKDRGWIDTREGKMTYNVSYRGKNTALIKIFWKMYIPN